MALKKIYLGDVGPFYVETTDLIADPDGDFPGYYHAGLVTNAPIVGLSFTGYVISTLEVTDIDDPSTELNAENAASIGAMVYCYETAAGVIDEFTLYLWDTSYGTEDPPYSVDGSSGGGWIAVGGKYQATEKQFNNNVFLQALTASTLLKLNSNKQIISHTKDSHIADAETSHTVTDPSDSPADADALRDDLVTNTIPSIETALNNLGTKINSILAAIENAELTETS